MSPLGDSSTLTSKDDSRRSAGKSSSGGDRLLSPKQPKKRGLGNRRASVEKDLQVRHMVLLDFVGGCALDVAPTDLLYRENSWTARKC